MAFGIPVPPPLGLGRPSQKSKKYKLIMVQNPIRARCCGFGEKDRRPIDPPPILQLFIEKPDGSLQNATEDDGNTSLFVVQCDLISEDGKEQRSHVFNPSSATSPQSSSTESIPTTGTLLTFHDPAPTRSLMGAVVSNAYQLTDQNNKPGIFFIFQDLSVRIEGRFRLKFMFTNLSAGDPLTMSAEISDDVLSKPFTVYAAKNFPGMTDSTLISQCFAQQGIKISIRKGRRIRHVADRTYSNNTVVETQQKAIASIQTSSTSTTQVTTTLVPSNNLNNNNNNSNNSNSNNNINNNINIAHTHHHKTEEPVHVLNNEQLTESPASTPSISTNAVPSTTHNTSSNGYSGGSSSSGSSSNTKPMYRRIDISTILTPDP